MRCRRAERSRRLRPNWNLHCRRFSCRPSLASRICAIRITECRRWSPQLARVKVRRANSSQCCSASLWDVRRVHWFSWKPRDAWLTCTGQVLSRRWTRGSFTALCLALSDSVIEIDRHENASQQPRLSLISPRSIQICSVSRR